MESNKLISYHDRITRIVLRGLVKTFLRGNTEKQQLPPLPPFRPEEFFYPDEEQKALEKLKLKKRRAHIIAGGTGFYELVKRGYIPEVKTIVSVMKLGLSYIRPEQEYLAVGATTVLQSLLEFGINRITGLEAVQDALMEIRPIQVRNVATIGGEVCISVPIVDLPVALLACDASVTIAGVNGEREVKLEDFYVDAFLTKLRYGELVKEVKLPKSKEVNTSSSFVKFGRTAYDFNLINCAASVTRDAAQKISSVRIFIGGIKRKPLRAVGLENELAGKIPSERLIFDACNSLFSKENFLPSIHGSAEYKHAVLPVIARDCLMRAYERSKLNKSSS